jgi:N-acetylglucosaminyl-diphospho-decaprenol L-rhamnosyltransferase
MSSDPVVDVVDVVVVAYRSAATIGTCLDSVVGDAAIGRVVVVDNASPDDSGAVAAAHGADVVAAAENRGFGAGCNLGFAATSSPFVLFLNPDAAVGPTTVRGLTRHLSANRSTAVVASALVAPDGRIEPSRRRRPSTTRALLEPGLAALLDDRHYRRRQPTGGSVDWVTGACFLVRREAFEAINGFDERYFLYSEEADLCARLRHSGWLVEWIPGLPCVHRSGHSTSQLTGRGKVAWVDGWLRYTRTHGRRPERLRRALVLGLTGRALIWRARRRPAHADVWRAAARRARQARRERTTSPLPSESLTVG